MRLLLASHNRHKLQEIRAILRGLPIELLDLSAHPGLPEPPEDSDTFVGNALQKARFVHQATGECCLADDSGLEVDALGGAPGVRSKRFTEEATAAANNAELLRRLHGQANRRARFRCAVALVGPGGEATAEGRLEGQIAEVARGQGGFGYDPLFLPDERPGRTLAELPPEEKNAISHRARALQALPGLLLKLGIQ